ncbi:hypothetical protein [Streptomyces sp. NPDC003247]|uniref:hypothetical protein n=1 Tax=Streptomyces sp. NPDC003247 TaxID=3364677 RepID=UPI00369E5411
MGREIPDGWTASAGDSDGSRELAARHTDVVFSANTEYGKAVAYAAELRERLARHGRSRTPCGSCRARASSSRARRRTGRRRPAGYRGEQPPLSTPRTD